MGGQLGDRWLNGTVFPPAVMRFMGDAPLKGQSELDVLCTLLKVSPAPPGKQKTSWNPSPLWEESVKPLEEGQQNLLPPPTRVLVKTQHGWRLGERKELWLHGQGRSPSLGSEDPKCRKRDARLFPAQDPPSRQSWQPLEGITE